MKIRVKDLLFLSFPHFLFFLVFKHYFIRCIDFTCITASSRASNYVTK